jgi:hypothetical protein
VVRFLRDNWIWIAAPIAIVIGLFAAVILLQGQQEVAPFIYTID